MARVEAHTVCGKFSTPLAVYQSQLSLRLRLGEFISLSRLSPVAQSESRSMSSCSLALALIAAGGSSSCVVSKKARSALSEASSEGHGASKERGWRLKYASAT